MNTPSDNQFAGAGRIVVYIALVLIGAILLAEFSFLLAALVAALALAPLVFVAVRTTRSRLGLVQPDFAANPAAYPASLREFETLPFENPFDPSGAHLPLDTRISMAAEASAQYSRGVCVLFLAVDDAEAQRAFTTLRDALRPSDHVEMVEGGIVCCLNLIRDLSNIDGVIARLTRRLVDSGWPQSSPPRFGRALYPMHGYSGADLIEAARAQLRPAPEPSRNPPARRDDRPAAARATPEGRRRKSAGANRR